MRNALKAFEAFLGTLDLRGYEEKYRSIKTVEQDLPSDLNPLPDLYRDYWKPTHPNPSFPSYEDFFATWWNQRLEALDRFIQKYFWGCSYQFVRLGLEARLYRTAISIWTQFHFGYRWLTSCSLSIDASPELDLKGVDILVRLPPGTSIGLQVKKETYRSEARGENRFLKQKRAHALLEVPYTLETEAELLKRAERARSRGELYRLWAKVASHLEHLPNGFVIFKESYVLCIEDFLQKNHHALSGHIPWEQVAREALA
ncbi:TaqI family restriction endonuclease [Thermus hydrothermalis]|jgi:hypothetical protein|uniref:TaqI family restriction endonuclease n=1 Tax=Thermus thalpophilus TaxID=2908147 RepID=UPI0009DD961B|nr:TaqI family restriction endonuclease [Thermus thalpophilus]